MCGFVAIKGALYACILRLIYGRMVLNHPLIATKSSIWGVGDVLSFDKIDEAAS